MAAEVLTIVKKTPVLAGVCGTDPFRQMPHFLKQIKDIGFSGVQNFPTVGLIDGAFRQGLEETEMGYGLEVDLIRTAHEMGLLTTPYCFNRYLLPIVLHLTCHETHSALHLIKHP